MKLPINQFLYLGIIGLFGASAWQFYETWREKGVAFDQSVQERLNEQTRQEIQAGIDQDLRPQGLDWPEIQRLDAFEKANLIGEEPPKPVEDVPDEPVEPETPVEQKTPLEDICEIVCLVFDGTDSRAVVRYLETAGVQPPEGVAPVADVPQPAVPTPNRPRPRTPPAPMPVDRGLQDGYVHILELDDALWEPFSHVKLVRVDDRAKYAEFVRQAGDGETEPERLYKDELELGQELISALDELSRQGVGIEPVRRPDDAPRDEVGGQTWRGTVRTEQIDGDYHIGTNDWQAWNDDPNRIVNQEIGTISYSKHGVSGVQVTKVSPRFQQFGVVEGDVIIALNGRPVGSKAEAIRVGKSLYKRGTRTFEVTFLSRGREVTRTYVAPEQRGR